MSILVTAVLFVLGVNVFLIVLLFVWMLWSRFRAASPADKTEPIRASGASDAKAMPHGERPVGMAKRGDDRRPQR